MPEIDYDEILNWLEFGDIPKLASDHGISERQASNIIHGRSKNFRFLEKVIAFTVEKKQRIISGMQRMKELNVPA